jgi:hypothetical protein
MNIKKFNEFNKINEGIITTLVGGFLAYKLLKFILFNGISISFTN